MALKPVPHGSDGTGSMVGGGEGEGGGSKGARYAAAVCVMYWLLLSYPLTLAIASVATLLVTILIYLKTLLRRRDSLARLTCRDSALCHYVTLHCHAFRRALQLPLWFCNRHVQSWLALCAREPGVQFERQYLQLSDKGLVALDWELGGQHLPHGHPVLLVLPDLPQSALQVGAVCREAFTFGLKAVVVNRRGQSNSPLNTPKIPGYGDTSDLREAVDFLRHEGITLSAVGIGTGGDLLLSYLGQYGSSAHLKSAVCISPSFSGENTLHHLAFPYSCLYLSHLKHTVLRHAKVFGDFAHLARHAWTVQEFDRRLHCVGNGSAGGDYNSLEEFWAENEPLREADEISIPLLCISSLDDPVCSSTHIPHELFRTVPNLFLLTLPQGGHAGFRQSLHGLSWAENAAMDFVLSMLTYNAHLPDVDSSCAHVCTQTDMEFFDFQCRTEDDIFDVDCRPEDELDEEKHHTEDDPFGCGLKPKERSPNGHCNTLKVCGHVEVCGSVEEGCASADGDCGSMEVRGRVEELRGSVEEHLDVDSLDVEVIEMERQTRSPTEGHGLR